MCISTVFSFFLANGSVGSSLKSSVVLEEDEDEELEALANGREFEVPEAHSPRAKVSQVKQWNYFILFSLCVKV